MTKDERHEAIEKAAREHRTMLDELGVALATIQCGRHGGRDDAWCSTCRGLRFASAITGGGSPEAWSLEHENRQLKREAKDIGAFIDAVIMDRDYFEALIPAPQPAAEPTGRDAEWAVCEECSQQLQMEQLHVVCVDCAEKSSPCEEPQTRCLARCTLYGCIDGLTDDNDPRESWICHAPLKDGRCPIHGEEITEAKQQAPAPPDFAPDDWCGDPKCLGGCGCTQTGVCSCSPGTCGGTGKAAP